jgi:hypothetical protein
MSCPGCGEPVGSSLVEFDPVMRRFVCSVCSATWGEDMDTETRGAEAAVHDGTRRYTCRDCEADFTLTEDQRRFFLSRNLAIPKRCPECRAAKRRLRREEGVGPAR